MSLLIEALKQAQARKKPKPSAPDSAPAEAGNDTPPAGPSNPSITNQSPPSPTAAARSELQLESPELSLQPDPAPPIDTSVVEPRPGLSLEPVVLDSDDSNLSSGTDIPALDDSPASEAPAANAAGTEPERLPASAVDRTDPITVSAPQAQPVTRPAKASPLPEQASAAATDESKPAAAPASSAAPRTASEGTASPQQTAQALLQAAKSERLSRLRSAPSRRRMWLGLGLLLATIAGLGGAYWYFTQPTGSFNIPPPSATDAESPTPLAESELVPTTGIDQASEFANEADALGDAGHDSSAAEAVADPVKQAVQDGLGSADGAPTAPVDEETGKAADVAATAAANTMPPTPAAFTQPTITIEKQSLAQPVLHKVEQPASPLQEAYAALNRGDLSRAEQLYKQALSRHPRHPDALLGLATIAEQRGLSEVAQRRYREVLHADPSNPIALSAVLGGLQVDQLPTAESDLRSAISRFPDQAALYFALGNVLSQRQRWSEAQQAYFEAATRDPTHPDYAFNLAVSLDQLAKPELAARFYRQALQLQKSRPASFALESARRRLSAIEGASGDVRQ